MTIIHMTAMADKVTEMGEKKTEILSFAIIATETD
jgi:hypothetical protein